MKKLNNILDNLNLNTREAYENLFFVCFNFSHSLLNFDHRVTLCQSVVTRKVELTSRSNYSMDTEKTRRESADEL